MRALHDSRPGALGFLRGDGAACRLLFDEREVELAPLDAEGNLQGFVADPARGLRWAGVVADGFTGPARRFDGGHGLLAADPRAATGSSGFSMGRRSA